jgi:hypothetical protein
MERLKAISMIVQMVYYFELTCKVVFDWFKTNGR